MTQEQTIIIHGPLASGGVMGQLIYSITLGNGYIVTNPSGFGEEQPRQTPTTRPLPGGDNETAIVQPLDDPNEAAHDAVSRL